MGNKVALPTLVHLTEGETEGQSREATSFRPAGGDLNLGPRDWVLSFHFAIRPRRLSTGQREDGEVGGSRLGFSTPSPAPGMPYGPSPALFICAVGLVWLLTSFLVLIFSDLEDI